MSSLNSLTPSEEDDAYAALRARRDEKRAAAKKAATKPAATSSVMSESERRDRIRQGLARKRECEEKALRIVERMAGVHQGQEQEGDRRGGGYAVDRQWMEEASRFLTPSHYSDAVSERVVSGLCGLPVCGAGAVDPKAAFDQKRRFRIDARNNRVFDVTERKKYCSDDCFKRSADFETQLSTEPLWMRDSSSMKFRATLQEAKQITQVSGQGDEIKLARVSRRDLDLEITSGQAKQGSKDGVDRKDETEKRVGKDKEHPDKKVRGDGEQEPGPPPSVFGHSPAKASSGKKAKRKPPSSARTARPLERVKKALFDWLTLGSLRALAESAEGGAEELRRRLREAGCEESTLADVFGDDASSPTAELERKLDSLALEREEEEVGAMAAAADEEKENHKSPMSIREEAEEEALKISAYFAGKMEYEKEEEAPEETEGAREPVLPLLDHHAQRALRRRVVMEQIEKVLTDIVQLCGAGDRARGIPPLLPGDVRSQLRRLVATFSLDAENVLLRPREWSLATIALLILLSQTDERIRANLESVQSSKYLGMMLLSFEADADHLKAHLAALTRSDLDRLVKKHENGNKA